MIKITKETQCMICKTMTNDGQMVLMSNGFICMNCCMEIATSELISISPPKGG